MWRKEARGPEMSAELRGAALRYGLRVGGNIKSIGSVVFTERVSE